MTTERGGRWPAGGGPWAIGHSRLVAWATHAAPIPHLPGHRRPAPRGLLGQQQRDGVARGRLGRDGTGNDRRYPQLGTRRPAVDRDRLARTARRRRTTTTPAGSAGRSRCRCATTSGRPGPSRACGAPACGDGRSDPDRLALREPRRPGGSGIESVHFLVEELPEDVKARFDLVGFDPRGVGQSTPVDWHGRPGQGRGGGPRPDTGHCRRDHRGPTDRVGATADACAKAQGELLPYVGTANAARPRPAAGGGGRRSDHVPRLQLRHDPRRHLRRPLPGQGPGDGAGRCGRPDHRCRPDG